MLKAKQYEPGHFVFPYRMPTTHAMVSPMPNEITPLKMRTSPTETQRPLTLFSIISNVIHTVALARINAAEVIGRL